MVKNCCATVFLRKDNGFEAKYFENAYVYEEKKIKSENGGRICCDSAVSRIFTNDELSVCCGDLIVFYIADSETLPDDCYTVTEVCDNRKSSQSHYRITAEK